MRKWLPASTLPLFALLALLQATAGHARLAEPVEAAEASGAASENASRGGLGNASGSNESSNATAPIAGDEKGSQGGDEFSELAHLQELPPLYFLFLSSVIKPVVTLIVFGPNRPRPPDTSLMGRAKWLAKQCMQMMFVGMAAVQAKSDAEGVWACLTSSVRWPVRIFATLVVLATSTNMQTAMSAGANYRLMRLTLAWRQCLGLEEGSIWAALGPAGTLYMVFFLVLYMPLFIFIVLVTLPCSVAYLWIFLPMFLILEQLALLFARTVHKALVCVRPGAKEEAAPIGKSVPETEGEVFSFFNRFEQITSRPFNLQVQSMLGGESSLMAMWKVEHECYVETGVVRLALDDFFVLGIKWAVPIALLTSVAARLYTGHGYIPSLVATFTERKFSTYFGLVWQKLQAKIQFAWLLL